MIKPIFWIGILLILIIPAHASVPQVVVTIKPIHALVSGIMEGVGTSYLLLKGGESPHTYSLRPSQIQRLHAAKLIIWVGPPLESFLEKTLSVFSNSDRTLRLIDLPGLTLLKAREDENWHTHSRVPYHGNKFSIDAHIWLSPDNAKIIIQTIAQALSKIDTHTADQYATNAARLIQRIEQFDHTLKQQLTPVKDLPYFVFHDAYQYFEYHYGLKAMGAVTVSPEVQPSAKRLYTLRHSLMTHKILCIFSEPQFKSALVNMLIAGTSVRHSVLDPLGADLTIGVDSYFALLDNLAHSLKQCLMSQQQ